MLALYWDKAKFYLLLNCGQIMLQVVRLLLDLG